MRIAVLGASRYNVPVLRSLTESGAHVLAIDGNAASPGFADATDFAVADIRDAAALRDAVIAHGGVDGIVSLNEAGVRSTARACRELGLPSISEEAAEMATSKLAMRRAWDAIPEFSVPWRQVHDEAEALAAGKAIGFPVVLKPDRTHGGSRGVTRAEDREQLARAFAFARESGMSQDVIVERCIESIHEHSTEVLVYDGEISVIAIGQKIKTPPPYRVDMSITYPSNDVDVARVEEMCRAAVEAIGLTTGVAHVEFAWTGGGPKLLELGARCGGGHTPLLAKAAGGVDEIAEVARIACGLAPVKFHPDRRGGAEYRFVIPPPGEVAEIVIPADVRAHPNVIDAEVLGGPGTIIREVRTGADRAGFIATSGRDRDEAVRIADWAHGRIKIRYAS